MIFHRVYHVAEVRKTQFGKGRMSSTDLSRVINNFAANGWVLDRVVDGETAYVAGLGAKEVFLIILRRDIKIPVPVSLVVDGQQKGPFDGPQIRALLSEGKVGPDTMAWKRGMTTCVPLAYLADADEA